MQGKNICLFLLLLLMGSSLAAQDLNTRTDSKKEDSDGPMRTLEEVMQIALENNSQLKRGELAARRDQIDWEQSRLNLLPSVSASLGHGINQGRSVDPTTNQFTESTFSSGSQGLSADLSLFNGFRMLHDIRMKGQARNAGRLELEGQVNEFKLDVIEAYIQVLTASDLWVQAQNQLEVTQEQLRRAEVMHEEGAFPPGDYFDIRGQLKNDENYVASTQQQLHVARLRLSRLMQVDEVDLGNLAPLQVSFSDRGFDTSDDGQALFKRAEATLPGIQALDYRIGEARQQIGIARSGFFPSLGIGAGLNSRYSDQYDTSYGTQVNQNLGKYISLSLRIPIFNRLQTLNQVRHARLGYEDALLQKELRLQQLKEETSKAVFDLNTAVTAWKNVEEQVAHYQESFRIAQVHFEAGASNSFLFLTAKNKVDAARQQLVLRQYEYLLQQYINDYYSGNLEF